MAFTGALGLPIKAIIGGAGELVKMIPGKFTNHLGQGIVNSGDKLYDAAKALDQIYLDPTLNLVSRVIGDKKQNIRKKLW